jgi:hypothetical protein
MSKPLLIAIAVLVLGGAAWFLLAPPTADAPTTADVTNESSETAAPVAAMDEQSEPALSGSASFVELMRRGEDYHCTFRSEADGMVSTGEFYTDGERYRVMADTTYDGGQAASNMLTDGTTTYVWSDTPDGTVALMMPNEDTVAAPATPEGYGADDTMINPNEAVEYECERWSVDEAIFAVPADIEFMDMQAMMEGMMPSIPQ